MFFRSSKSAADKPSPEPAGAGSSQAAPATAAQPIASTSPAQAQPPAAEAGAQMSEEAQRRAMIAVHQSMAFAQIVNLMSRSPVHKFFTLADLEWLVIPPLTTGQFAIASAKPQPDAPSMPVAVVLWASVSAETDQRLSGNPDVPVRLRPDEWRSGDILWLIDSIGDQRAVQGLMDQLAGTRFEGRPIKARIVKRPATPAG